MSRRTELQEKLKQISGVANVYFQPPESFKMTYPCIRYETSGKSVGFANNSKYRRNTRYTVTVIDQDPESSIAEALENLDYCRFDRSYRSGNLNHFVFTLYF